MATRACGIFNMQYSSLLLQIASIKCGMANLIYDLSSHVEHEMNGQTPSMELIKSELPGKEDDPSTNVSRIGNLERSKLC